MYGRRANNPFTVRHSTRRSLLGE